jgi:hypothetical protein
LVIGLDPGLRHAGTSWDCGVISYCVSAFGGQVLYCVMQNLRVKWVGKFDCGFECWKHIKKKLVGMGLLKKLIDFLKMGEKF